MRRGRVYERMLEREREKLERLIDATMDGPIALNEEILTQSKKVDDLIAMIQEMGRGIRKGGSTAEGWGSCLFWDASVEATGRGW